MDDAQIQKHPGGRPPKWESPEQLQEKVDAWIKSTEIYTVNSLCDYLDCDPRTVANYQAKDEYFSIIARARRKVAGFYEKVGCGLIGKGGQGFADRMLTRMGWPCVEESKRDHRIQTQIVSFADAMDADAKELEGDASDT